MVRTPCRRVLAAVVLAIVAGIALHDAAGGGERASAVDPGQDAAIASDWAPPGAGPVARRARGGADGDLHPVLEALRTPALGLTAALAGAAAAPAWWMLRRPAGGAGPRLRRTPLPVLRAPPASA